MLQAFTANGQWDANLGDIHIANKMVGYLYKPVDDALFVEETLRRCDMVGGNGVAASVFVLRPGNSYLHNV